MLVKESAIKDSALKNLEKELKGNYFFKEGGDLNSALREVLNNRTLNLYLLSFLPVKNGIRIGGTSYFDDISVEVYYGLAINFDEVPRKVGLFISEGVNGNNFKLKEITNYFPSYEHKDPFRGWPSPSKFLQRVNEILSSEDIRDYLVDLRK